MIKLIPLLLFTLITYERKGTEKSCIYYNSKIKLTWNDFVPVKKLNDASAESSTKISYNYEETNGKITVKIYCIFDKMQSFVVQNKKTDYLLNHEQRHFDITHIFTKLLYKRFKENNNLSFASAEEIYNTTIIEWQLMQDKYDIETNYSINTIEQQKWDNKIDNIIRGD